MKRNVSATVERLKVHIVHEYLRFLIYWQYRLYQGEKCEVQQLFLPCRVRYRGEETGTGPIGFWK